MLIEYLRLYFKINTLTSTDSSKHIECLKDIIIKTVY